MLYVTDDITVKRGNYMKRTFTKHPSSYVKACEEMSSGLFEGLVETYLETDLGYSDIVSELEKRYNTDDAKDVAAVVCRRRRDKEAEEDRWHRWCDSHSGPRPDEEIYNNIDWIAQSIARRLKAKGLATCDVEQAIEFFTMMCEDYEDWWSRGANTREKEQKFISALADALLKYGIELVY